jgi:hypothetical protein
MTPEDQTLEGILLDSSIWRRTHLLRSHEGEALIHNIRTAKRRLLVPEVVEKELIFGAKEEALKAHNEIGKLVRKIRDFSGHDMSFALPSESDLDYGMQRRMEELDDILVRIPMTLDHAQRALDRVIEGQPPNAKEEQFRDSLIWQCLMSQLNKCSKIYFITGDKAFFEPSPKRSHSN